MSLDEAEEIEPENGTPVCGSEQDESEMLPLGQSKKNLTIIFLCIFSSGVY